MRRAIPLAGAGLAGLVLLVAGAAAQQTPAFETSAETRFALRTALQDRQQAEQRSLRLEREAAAAGNAAERAAREAAALAARIQQAEAGIAAAEARIGLVDRERANLREELGREQQPVVELTAALQQFSRRPLALSVARPGSVKDVVYLRAMLSSAMPEVHRRTALLRQRIARGRILQREAERAAQVLRAEEQRLGERRTQLAAVEARQRFASREAGDIAAREAERALGLAEQARDLDALVAELDRAGLRRESLAALPGPVLRPPQPERARVVADAGPAIPAGDRASPPLPYLLPVTGRMVTGFGAPAGAGLSQGLTLAPRGSAQVVAPATGRVAFAGPYRGYGQIVIIEHAGNWTSLVTGLARTEVSVGEQLVGGAPIGLAAEQRPVVSLELRRGTEPINPLRFVG